MAAPSSPITGDAFETSFGSDKDGLVWGYRFSPGAPAAAVDCDGAARLLAEAPRADGSDSFLWLHFSLANAAAERWMRQHLSLPDSFQAGLTEGASTTRVEQEGDALVAVIHDVLFDFQFDPADVSTVCLYVGPRIMVSARPRPLRSLDRLKASIKAGASFSSPADLLAHLLQDQAMVLVGIVRQTTTRVDTIEDSVLHRRVSVSRAELSSLRRLLVRLERLLAPEPASLFRLLSRPPQWIDGHDLQNLRQSAEEFSTAVADSGALVERIKLLQEELAAVINEQNNRILFLLTLATVLALPFNVIAGLFGMNVGGIPLAAHRHGFGIILALVAAITAVGFLALRRKEW
jgi:zinc transporter